MRRNLAAVAVAVLALAAPATAGALESTPLPTDVTDGAVNDIAIAGHTAYVGGSFDTIGPRTGPGVALDAATGNDLRLPQVAGGTPTPAVTAVIPDGAGGWYIGGSFTSVGGVARANAARILADGTVGAWDPHVNGQVNALARSGSTVYLGGTFNDVNSVGTATRNYAAAVDATTGAVRSWNPDLNGQVLTLAVSGSTVYMGGSFNAIDNGATTRDHAAAVDATSGAATGWNPDVSDDVHTLAISGSTVYLGGSFGAVNAGATTRDHVAAVSATTGTATAWDPDANGDVDALAISGSTVYLGGQFGGDQSINQTAHRDHLAAVSATTGAVTAWDPGADDEVDALAVAGGTVYAAGRFHQLGGAHRTGLGAADATSGAVTAWDPTPTAAASALAVDGATVYVGGSFSSINASKRDNIAALDLETGRVTAWNPDVTGVVNAVLADGDKVYLGGSFTTVNGGTTRTNLAAFGTTTGSATSWAPTTDDQVAELRRSGSTIYALGSFGQAAGSPRNGLAAFDATTGALTPFNPGTGITASALAVTPTRAYVGGSVVVHTVATPVLEAVDPTTGAVDTSWRPTVQGGGITAVDVVGSNVFVGGNFTALNGTHRQSAGAIDVTTGHTTAWDPQVAGGITALAATASSVFVDGQFAGAGAVNGSADRTQLAEVDAAGGTVSGWAPQPALVTVGMTAADGVVGVGGIGGTFGDRGSFALFGAAPQVATAPADQSVTDGDDATFSATIGGGPLPDLQWQRSTDGGATFADVGGATSATLTVPAASLSASGTRYRIKATNMLGAVTSAAATLTVTPVPPQVQPPPVTPPAQTTPVKPPPPPAPRAGAPKLVTKSVTLKAGVAHVTVSCTGATTCTGRIRLTVPLPKRHTLIVATGSYTVKAGRTAALKLRVGTAAQKTLFRTQAHRTVTVTLTPRSGKAIKSTLTVKKQPAKKKARPKKK